MNQPNNKILYDKVKRKANKIYKKPSAYKSGYIVKEYKKLGGTYSGNKNNSSLKRWYDEKWNNQRGEVGYKNKSDVYRPTKRINRKTPTTFNELSKDEIKKAMKQKLKYGRVKKFKTNKK